MARVLSEEQKEKARVRSAIYRQKNPEKVKEGQRKWRLENKDRKLEMDRLYRESHREELRTKDRERYAENPEFLVVSQFDSRGFGSGTKFP